MSGIEGIAEDFSRENSQRSFSYDHGGHPTSARGQQQHSARRHSTGISSGARRNSARGPNSARIAHHEDERDHIDHSQAPNIHSINDFSKDNNNNNSDDDKNNGCDDQQDDDNINSNNSGGGTDLKTLPAESSILRTDCQQLMLILLLICNIVFGGGLWVAVQSFYGPLEGRGFCAAKCGEEYLMNHTSTTKPCAAQKKCLAQPVNLGMSMLNLLGVVFGALGDILGGLSGFVMGNIICITGPLLFSIDPENGTGYAIAVPLCAVGCALSFFAVLSQLIPKYMSPERIGLSCSCFTSFWDTAMAVAPLIGIMLSSTDWSVFVVFMIVGLVSIPSTIAVLVLVFYHERKMKNLRNEAQPISESTSLLTQQNISAQNIDDNKKQGEEGGNNNNNDQQEQEQEQKPKESFFHVARRVIANWRFVALTCGATSTVTYGYFVMTNLGLLVSTHGAPIADTHSFERNASIIMGVLGGATGVVIGKVIDAGNWRFRCRVIAVIQTIMLGVISVLVTVESIPWQYQYGTFVIVTLWRMMGFSGINASWNKAMFEAGDGAAAGIGLGLLYSVAGGISLIIGRIGTQLAHDGHFIEVHLILAIVFAFCHLIQAAFGY